MITEHDSQVSLFDWIDTYKIVYPQLECAFAIPNGGFRHIVTAMRLKAEGVRAGVPDIFIAYPMNKKHGLFIEMKVGKNKPTENQKEWLFRLAKNGYAVFTCYSWIEAARTICEYLNLPKSIVPEEI